MSEDSRGGGFDRLCELFEAARAMAPTQRDALLTELQATDPHAHAELVDLLDHHDDQSSLLDNPVTPAEIGNYALPPPDRIGNYDVVKKLGEGGMGVVYLARQDHPQREVAVKVMRAGLLSRELTRRFELETTLLGRLQHPGVARIYAAGIDERHDVRLPYFVMEYVNGPTLRDFIKQHNPPLHERLHLFSEIVDAVAYAHQKGIIHRDLKPGNILISVEDDVGAGDVGDRRSTSQGKASPKILDFGVARATDADLQATTLLTSAGQLVGTLPYMSPEQVSGEADAIDVRSDVYALGVILFEMLAGKLPYDLKEHSIVRAARTIAESEPERLSSTGGSFDVDLSTIVAKALEKSPERRYQSAADLGADIQRYLHDEPVQARPASSWYQFQKFSQRNKGLVGGVAASIVALVLGIAGTTWQAIVATRQRELAESDANRVHEVNDFLNNVFTATHARHLGDSVTIKQAIAYATKSIDEDPPGDGRVEADIRRTIAASYEAVGEYGAAELHLVKATTIDEAVLGAPSWATLRQRGHVLTLQSRFDEAEALLREALDVARASGEPIRIAKSLGTLANALQDKMELVEAERLARDAIDILEQRSDMQEHKATAWKLLGTILLSQARYEEAEEVLNQALELAETEFGTQSFGVSDILNSIAILYGQIDRMEDAVSAYERVIDIQRDLLAEDHPDLAISRINLGASLHEMDRSEEAEPYLQQAYAVLTKRLGPDAHPTLIAKTFLAQLRFAAGKVDEAGAMFEELLEQKAATLGRDAVETSTSMLHLAEMYRIREEFESATALTREALTVRINRLGEEHPRTLSAMSELAETCRIAGDAAEAERLYRRVYELRQQTLGGDHPQTKSAAEKLAEVEAALSANVESKGDPTPESPNDS